MSKKASKRRSAKKAEIREAKVGNAGKKGKKGGLPAEMRNELRKTLDERKCIDWSEVDPMFERYGIFGDTKKLQLNYGRQEVRTYFASLRDENGDRMVLAAKGGRFVMVDFCEERADLQAMHERIRGGINGLKKSDSKVLKRVEALKAAEARASRPRKRKAA